MSAMKLTAEQIVKACGGILLCGDPKTEITSFSTDSRSIQPGCLFVPIKGERTDAHIYMEATLAAGAAGTFTQHHTVPAGDSHVWIYVEDTTRASSTELMQANGLVDLLIPRGGAGLIRACVEQATVPVIQTGTGICHVYVDKDADLNMALDILENAKCSRPSVCNACEVCLVHADVAEQFLPMVYARLVKGRQENPVELRLDARAAAIIPGTPAGDQDFDTEFLDYILAVGVVDSVSEAIDHINAHSTGHSEAIITADEAAARAFTTQVDSSSVYWNASTRFTDGGQFGLGCEMGISTQRLHARGPMGLGELCTYKYIVRGDGQTR